MRKRLSPSASTRRNRSPTWLEPASQALLTDPGRGRNIARSSNRERGAMTFSSSCCGVRIGVLEPGLTRRALELAQFLDEPRLQCLARRAAARNG
jgi:hypothetical protein